MESHEVKVGGAVQIKEEVQRIGGNLLCVTRACLGTILDTVTGGEKTTQQLDRGHGE